MIKRWQAAKLHGGLYQCMKYLARLCERMQTIGFVYAVPRPVGRTGRHQ
jgi:hypothetical protein